MDERPGSDPDLTADLLDRARAGDRSALDALFARHVPLLRRWAAGRLPRWARDAMDTVDVVQETMLAALRNLDTFESRGDGALQAYLRQALINRIRSQIRNAMGRPERGLLESGIPDDATSPLEAVIGREKIERYERALNQLSAEARSAVVARVEMGLGYAEIAELLDKNSADAARMMVARAVVRLAELMQEASEQRRPD